MNRYEGRLPEGLTAAIEYSLVLREEEVLRTHGVYDAILARMQDFANYGVTVTHHVEVVSVFKTYIAHLAKRQVILQGADFIQDSVREDIKTPTISVVLEQPMGSPIEDIRGYTLQPVRAYLVTAQPNGSLLFTRENRVRYSDPTLLRDVLTNPQELARFRPNELTTGAIAEGMCRLYPEYTSRDPSPMVE